MNQNIENIMTNSSKVCKMFADVKEFSEHFGYESVRKDIMLLFALMKSKHAHLEEEVGEIYDATFLENNLADAADGVVDLIYVALGFAWGLGIEEHEFAEAWDRVHAANMKKQAVGNIAEGKGGIVKPEGWSSPDIDSVFRNKRFPF